jgi:hypothetical protein
MLPKVDQPKRMARKGVKKALGIKANLFGVCRMA